MLRPVLHAVMITLLLTAFGVQAARPVPADGQCPTAADERWTPQEAFVWGRVCIGQVADFNAAPEYGGDLDPKRPEGLPDNRVLSSAFIETILLSDKYRQALTRNGVRITGARFAEAVDLSGAEIAHELWLNRSLLEKGAVFRNVRSTKRITLDGTRVIGPFVMRGARVEEDLSISNAEYGDADLGAVQVGGKLSLTGSISSGMLDLLGAEISGHLVMNQGRFTDVVLVAAHVHREFVLDQSKVAGTLNMLAIRVDGNLDVNGSELEQVQLGNAHLLANLAFEGTTVHRLLDMTNLQLDGNFSGQGGKFAEIRLVNGHVGGFVMLAESKVRGLLNMGLSRIDGFLVMSRAEFGAVDLAKTHLLGVLTLGEAKVSGLLDMENLHIDGTLYMNLKSEFSDVRLAHSYIGGSLTLQGSKVRGTLNMSGQQLVGFLMLNGAAEFAEISLVGARVGAFLSLRGSKVTGALDLESIEVHGNVLLGGGAEFSGPVNLIFGNIGELELANSTFHSEVDITGAQTRSDLVLGPPPPHWSSDSTLNLHNARADAIQDSRDSWPAKLDLTGFTYRSLGGVHTDERDRMADRPVKWFKSWLAKGQYSPQPYVQLAAVLRDAGRPDAADAILSAGKQRERQDVGGLQRVWLTTLDWSVGYGYHVERTFYWVAGFILVGVVVLRVSGEGRRHGMPYGLAYSFDLLLPIIHLREMHYSIELAGWPRYYFYVHKFMGYVLASFLAVGVSGLVK
jgi:hypothetical protein